jgi:hypothetical protein
MKSYLFTDGHFGFSQLKKFAHACQSGTYQILAQWTPWDPKQPKNLVYTPLYGSPQFHLDYRPAGSGEEDFF